MQDDKGLTITREKVALPLPGIANQALASGSQVLRLTNNKGWFNDDDPGAVVPGWFRQGSRGMGDFNNDLTGSNTPGDVWMCSFTSKGMAVIAPKESGAGKMEITIDEKKRQWKICRQVVKLPLPSKWYMK